MEGEGDNETRVMCYDVGVPVKCETKQKRNETKQIETKRNRSKRNETNRNETKQIERNETNDMASHCGQISVFSNIRNSFRN